MGPSSSARRQWMVLALMVVLLSAGSAFADGPRSPLARCSALLANGRTLVDVAADHLLSDDLVRLVRLGMTGRLQVEVTVIRRQPFWFDAVVLEERRELVVTALAEGSGLLLDGTRVLRDVDRLELDRLALRPRPEVLPEEVDRYRVEVKLRFQVITAGSLRQVARWITSGDGEEQGAVSRRLLDAVASDLTREASARCDVELSQRPAARAP
ncbi:MAG TPA: hypothetical protein VFA20_10800 [Myxococcaceae bacterium]|nr:hypothetical protein [Myxococcaceae bacterium]